VVDLPPSCYYYVIVNAHLIIPCSFVQVINPQGSNGQFADTNASPLRVKGGYVDVGIREYA